MAIMYKLPSNKEYLLLITYTDNLYKNRMI